MTTEERIAGLSDRALALVLCVVEDRPPSPERLELRRVARAEWQVRVARSRAAFEALERRAAARKEA